MQKASRLLTRLHSVMPTKHKEKNCFKSVRRHRKRSQTGRNFRKSWSLFPCACASSQGYTRQASRRSQTAAAAAVRLRVAVAGDSHTVWGDPGPGPGVHGVPIERGAGGALCNPFPMGEGGADESRRQLVLDHLHHFPDGRLTP